MKQLTTFYQFEDVIMAKRKKSEKRELREKINIKEETIQGVIAVIFFVIAIFLSLGALDKAGMVGHGTYYYLEKLVGVGYYILPLLFIMLGLSSLKALEQRFSWAKGLSAIFFFFSSLGIISLLAESHGGIVGKYLSMPLLKLFDFYASLVFLIAVLIISLIIIFEIELKIETLFFWRRFKRKDVVPDEEDGGKKEVGALALTQGETEALEAIEAAEEEVKKPAKSKEPEIENPREAEANFMLSQKRLQELHREFTPLPLELLERDRGKPGVGDIKANANIIKRTLLNFGIDVEMDEISIGPSVTRYALKPAEGVKLSRILALQNDLALALAAHPIRIEAPIPGKSLVGIEIPNSTKTTVGLGTLLADPEYQGSEKPLLISLGKGISGKSHFANLAKMPHLLIAGATGSGKSVTIHSIITSLLFRNPAEKLKFIMIDPKRVELTLYNKIAHLLTPVITDAKKAILSLKWAAKEMDRRYDILESNSVRDIESYHKNILIPALKKLEGKTATDDTVVPETMPYIVIVIDELADIMTSYPRELEAAIVRLAQMSRAVGIHLMLSTQRPSVNVITGLIKANIPARIALQVASQIDSRTILDTSGAEKLLGAGDMLYLSGEMSKPARIQSSFISESEVKKVVKHLIDTYKDSVPSEINLTGENQDKNALFESTFDSESLEDDDDLYEEAREEVLKAGKASTSYLQRKLRIGYARAARLVDLLEERGVIGRGDGAKAREVLGASGTGIPPEEVSDQNNA